MSGLTSMMMHSNQVNICMNPTVRWRAMFIVSCCFYLLTCSGRMGSADAYTQLQASINLLLTGSLSTDDPTLFKHCSVPSPDGRYYQAHDPGNLVLFVPSAIIAVLSSREDRSENLARNVPLPGRIAASLTYAFVGAVCITAIYITLCQVLPHRPALAFTILTGCGTPLWIYTRCTMDVLPAALGIAITIGTLLARANQRITTYRAVVVAAVGVAFAGWFRVSILPFLATSALIVILCNEHGRRWRSALVYCSILVTMLLPVLVYNYIRSGNPFILGTMHPIYESQNGFSGDIATGLYGLILSPNHGLFIFAPWLLMSALPSGLASLKLPHRIVIGTFLLGAVAYTVLIASLKQWAKVEWGPRYLVPILPILAVLASLAALRLWRSRCWPIVVTLALLSLATTIPAGIVNYSYVVTDYPNAANPLASRPEQILGAYQALLDGIRGHETIGPLAIRNDPERRAGLHFPDFFIARLFEQNLAIKGVGLTIAIVLNLGLILGILSLLRNHRTQKADLDIRQ